MEAKATHARMILVIGTLREAVKAGRGALQDEGVRFVSFRDLTRDLLADTKPEMVLSALMGEGFDALDLARVLSDLGFQGLYRALTPPLPDPKSVRDEILGAAPGLDFDLLIVGPQIH